MNGEALLETRALASVSNIEILKLHFAGRPPNEIIEKTTAAFVGRAWRGRGVAGRAGLNNHTTWGAISGKQRCASTNRGWSRLVVEYQNGTIPRASALSRMTSAMPCALTKFALESRFPRETFPARCPPPRPTHPAPAPPQTRQAEWRWPRLASRKICPRVCASPPGGPSHTTHPRRLLRVWEVLVAWVFGW